jgi:hypothetical protein
MNKFLKFSLYLILGLVFTEIALRIIKPAALEFYFAQKQFHKLDPLYLVDLEPNTNAFIKQFQGRFEMKFTTNEFGFRGTDKIDNSRPQIICIGDSVTMGFGVNDDDTFCRSLNGYKDASGNSYQALNLGVDAYGPTNISRKLKKYIPQLNAKLIYYFPSNGDDIDEINLEIKENNPLTMKLFQLQFLAAKYSYLFLGFRITYEQLGHRFNEAFIYPVIRFKDKVDCILNIKTTDCPKIGFESMIMGIKEDFTFKRMNPQEDPPVFGEKVCEEVKFDHPIPEKVYKSTNEIIEYAKQQNIKLVMFQAPIDIESAYCSQRGKIHFLYNYQRTFKKFLDSNHLDYIDLNTFTKEMVDKNGFINPRPYYILGDGHYTVLGNKWVSKHLLEKTNEILGKN